MNRVDRRVAAWTAVGLPVCVAYPRVGAVVLFVLVLVRMSGFVTQVRRQSQQLHDLATRDDLTGLPNRRLLKERLVASVAAGPTQARTAVAVGMTAVA